MTHVQTNRPINGQQRIGSQIEVKYVVKEDKVIHLFIHPPVYIELPQRYHLQELPTLTRPKAQF